MNKKLFSEADIKEKFTTPAIIRAKNGMNTLKLSENIQLLLGVFE